MALKYIRALENICNEHGIDNFRFYLRLSVESLRQDAEYFKKWIPEGTEKVWVRGPEKFNWKVKGYLAELGFKRNQVIET